MPAARPQHVMSPAQLPVAVPPPSPAPLLLAPEELAPAPQGDWHICDSHVKTGPSHIAQAVVWHACSWVRHIVSRQLTQAAE